jgi:uncharacterized membrane protein YdjX (TVP38/TMEM64 family)
MGLLAGLIFNRYDTSMKTKIILVCAIAALIAAFFFLDIGQYLNLEYLKLKKDSLNALYQQQPILISGVFFVIYVLVAAFALPAALLLTVASGAILGFWNGLFIVSFASSIGATIAFLLTRYLFHDAIQAKFGDRLSAVNLGIEREGAFYVFGLRLVPLFPFVVVNSLLGLTKLNTWTFYWASQIGMLAGTAVFVNAGTQLADIDSLGDILSLKFALSFALLGVFPILAKTLLKLIKPSSDKPA